MNTQTLMIKRPPKGKSTDRKIDYSLGKTKIFPHCLPYFVSLRKTSENVNLLEITRLDNESINRSVSQLIISIMIVLDSG